MAQDAPLILNGGTILYLPDAWGDEGEDPMKTAALRAVALQLANGELTHLDPACAKFVGSALLQFKAQLTASRAEVEYLFSEIKEIRKLQAEATVP